MKTKQMLLSAWWSILGLFAVSTATAWNETGHMTIAELAWRKLSKAERTTITALLREHPHYAVLLATNVPKKAETNHLVFLRAATWPDMVRPSFGKSAFITNHHRRDWHFTNAPYVAPADVGTIQPPAHGAGEIHQALAESEAIIKNVSNPAAERAVAVCWLLHLLGDLHQPLHCVAWFSAEFPNGDLGGNRVAVRPNVAARNLHSYWDDLLGEGTSTNFISQLANTIANAPGHATSKLKELRRKTYGEWAQESFDDAEDFAYLEGLLEHVKIPSAGIDSINDATVPALTDGYKSAAQIRAHRRAALAGIRLKRKLKELF